MITVLSGENSFEVSRELEKMVSLFDGLVEKVDGSELDPKRLPDLLMGTTLFDSKRLIVIKNLSLNKVAWSGFGEWIPRVSSDIDLILIDTKPDKRTKTYKDIQRTAVVQEFKLWTERDASQAEKWAIGEAKRLGVDLSIPLARGLVSRVGVDQWHLYWALEKLSVFDEVSSGVIEELIDAQPVESVFNLLDAALKGNLREVRRMIRLFETTMESYQLFGLLSGQIFHLAILSTSSKSSGEVAKELGVHPFSLSKLTPFVNRLGKTGVSRAVSAFTEADTAMKTTATEPWLLIERALMKVAVIK